MIFLLQVCILAVFFATLKNTERIRIIFLNIVYIIYIHAYLDAVFLCESFCIFLKKSERNEKGDFLRKNKNVCILSPDT